MLTSAADMLSKTQIEWADFLSGRNFPFIKYLVFQKPPFYFQSLVKLLLISLGPRLHPRSSNTSCLKQLNQKALCILKKERVDIRTIVLLPD